MQMGVPTLAGKTIGRAIYAKKGYLPPHRGPSLILFPPLNNRAEALEWSKPSAHNTSCAEAMCTVKEGSRARTTLYLCETCVNQYCGRHCDTSKVRHTYHIFHPFIIQRPCLTHRDSHASLLSC
jgi:hypothetical protein